VHGHTSIIVACTAVACDFPNTPVPRLPLPPAIRVNVPSRPLSG
jgi:hypothetical protein